MWHIGTSTRCSQLNNQTMSVSQTSNAPALAGYFITMETVKKKTETRLRFTKIICTIGPACWTISQLEQMMDAGMNVARLNFSHGDHAGHGAVLERVRQAAKNKNKNVGKSTKKRYYCVYKYLYL